VEGVILFRQPSGDADHLGESQLDHASGVGERRVKDRDSLIGRAAEIDMVGADAERPDRNGLCGIGQDGPRHPGPRADAEQLHALQSLAQFPLVERARKCAHVDASISEASSGIRVDAFYQEGLHTPIPSGCPDIFASLSRDGQDLPG
jgi:hypothetical protein